MGQTRRARQKRRVPATTTDPPAWQQHIVAVGVVQHPTTRHYQVWLHAHGQTAMLLAYRTLKQADAAKEALGEAIMRGDFVTPERWCAAVAAIGADADAPLEPVSDAVFASITASIQEAKLDMPDAPAPDSTTPSEAPEL